MNGKAALTTGGLKAQMGRTLGKAGAHLAHLAGAPRPGAQFLPVVRSMPIPTALLALAQAKPNDVNRLRTNA